MVYELKDITKDNFYEVGLLTTNASGMPTFDEEYICANSVSLAESKFYSELLPQAIYLDNQLIGFIMSGPYECDNNNFWILRFMIDYKFQGKGYGKKAFLVFIEQIRSKRKGQIFLGLHESNKVAIVLYESCGFRFTGIEKDEELVYVLDL
ncbi:GNAT family N-acetyltransferase [Myroides odoratimimus]|nr:GNAT family N-acetyltransferase [Myroides odoratimimus]MDM1475125.1 GNAT family N-acetyltransferase [Myroides odoratimimus]